jgi:hypothetical protein
VECEPREEDRKVDDDEERGELQERLVVEDDPAGDLRDPKADDGHDDKAPICCATRTSFTRVEMRIPSVTDSRVSSGTITMIASTHRGA